MVETMEGEWWNKDTAAWEAQDWLDAVLHHFEYVEEEGELYWKHPTNRRIVAGSPAGTIDKDGYVIVTLYGKLHKLHRIVWLIHHKTWPTHTIDHMDHDPSNNKITNLQDITLSENSRLSHYEPVLPQEKGDTEK